MDEAAGVAAFAWPPLMLVVTAARSASKLRMVCLMTWSTAARADALAMGVHTEAWGRSDRRGGEAKRKMPRSCGMALVRRFLRCAKS